VPYMNVIFPVAFVIGRILVGAFFISSGLNHFTKHSMMAGYAKSQGVPAAGLGVAVSGILLIFGGVSLLLGWHPSIGALCLVICLILFAFGIHHFWKVPDPQARQNDMIHFMKDLALLGFVLFTLMIPRPWPWSLGR